MISSSASRSRRQSGHAGADEKLLLVAGLGSLAGRVLKGSRFGRSSHRRGTQAWPSVGSPRWYVLGGTVSSVPVGLWASSNSGDVVRLPSPSFRARQPIRETW